MRRLFLFVLSAAALLLGPCAQAETAVSAISFISCDGGTNYGGECYGSWPNGYFISADFEATLSISVPANATITNVSWHDPIVDASGPCVSSISRGSVYPGMSSTTVTVTGDWSGGAGPCSISADMKLAELLVTYTVPSPSVASFTASPVTIMGGSSSTLSWACSNSTSASISPGVGSVSTSGSADVYPTSTTTYTLTCSSAYGSASDTESVTVIQGPSVGSFSANPSSIYAGQSSTLNWQCLYSANASINPDLGSVNLSGSASVSPSSSTTYTLVCSNFPATRLANVTVTVIPAATVGSFTGGGTVYPGGSKKLSYTCVDATSASISGIGSVSVPSGAVTVSPSSTTTYTLTCSNQAGDDTAQQTVTVASGPTANIWSSRTYITPGSNAYLNWECANAASASINQGIGSVGLSGILMVSPSSTRTYTLTCENGGTDTDSVTVNVIAAPSVTSFTGGTTISPGGSATLNWACANSTAASIAPGVGSVATSGSQQVSPTGTITYTLTCSNQAGYVQSTQTVVVSGSTNHSPKTVRAEPNSGVLKAGVWYTFDVEVSDEDGYENINYYHLQLSAGPVGEPGVWDENSCFLYIIPSTNMLYLRDDEDTDPWTGYEFGSANELENSQCKVDYQNSALTNDGNTSTASIRLMLKPTFTAGGMTKHTWAWVIDQSSEYDGWNDYGGWVLRISKPRMIVVVTD